MADDELDALLERAADAQEERVEEIVPSEIKIAKNARIKASPTLGRLLADMGGRALEWYSLMLGKKTDPEPIVRDIVLPGKQDVTGAHVGVEGEEVAKVAAQLAGTGKYTLGWLHNHADISTFHSGEDDRNMEIVLNSVSLNTEKATHARFDLIQSAQRKTLEDGRIHIRGKDLEDAMMEYSLKHPEKVAELLTKFGIPLDGKQPSDLALALLNDMLDITSFKVREPRIIGYAYSIVVNNRNDTPYTEIAVVEEDVLSRKKRTYRKERVPLTIVEVPDDITIDEAALRKEIREKIDLPKRDVITVVSDFVTGRRRRRMRVQPSYEQAGQGRLVDPGHFYTPTYTNYTHDDDGPDNVNLQELCERAAEHFEGYLDRHTDDDALYTGHFGKVVEGLLTEHDLRKAFVAAGAMQEDKNTERPPVLDDKNLETCIYASLYYPLKKAQDKAVIDFLVDVAADNDRTWDDVLQQHAPILANPQTPLELTDAKEWAMRTVNPVAEEFATTAFDYARDGSKDWSYNYWLAYVLEDYAKSDESLAAALLGRGRPNWNKSVGFRTLTDAERRKVRRRLNKEKDALTLQFMEELNKASPANRGYEQLFEEVVTLAALRDARTEGTSIDNLLGGTPTTPKDGYGEALITYTSRDPKERYHNFLYGAWMTVAIRSYLAEPVDFDAVLQRQRAAAPLIKGKGLPDLTPQEKAAFIQRVGAEPRTGDYARFADDFTLAMHLDLAGKPASPTDVLRRYLREPAGTEVDKLLEAP